jgi:predicted DNA binding protein
MGAGPAGCNTDGRSALIYEIAKDGRIYRVETVVTEGETTRVVVDDDSAPESDMEANDESGE